jgi:spore germination protein GerM
MPASGQIELDMPDLLKRFLDGPPGPGQSLAFPERSGLKAAFLVDGLAVVDLTGPVRTGGGASTETARVYGIVQTLHANFPEVKSVRLLVDGQEVDTLLGHLDLSRPLVPEPRLLARPARKTRSDPP